MTQHGEVSAPINGHKNARWQAGAKENYTMSQFSLKSVIPCKSESVASVIHGLLSRSDDGVIAIAPGIASRILEETNFAGQRRVVRSRVAERVHDIKAGTWNPRVCAIAFAETPDGKLYLVNGQHRCHAIVDSQVRIDNAVTIIPVADMAGVRRVYALFDTPESKRSDMDMLDGIGAAESLGLKRKTAAAVFRALSVIRNGMEPVSGGDAHNEAKSRNVRREELPEWAEEAKLLESIFSMSDNWIVAKVYAAGSMAFALYVLRHARKDAINFLRGIAENDGLRRNDPRARLLADFQTRSVNAGNARQGVQRWSVAWNAFVEGRDLSIVKCFEGAPIVIKGTPMGKVGGR